MPLTSSAAVTDPNRAKLILSSINWDFSTPFPAGRSGVRFFDCRKHHWFNASFVPEIPYSLIEVLTKPGATVYDPFAGIGTTVFQALALGRRPYATEICLVAVDFMKKLWTLFRAGITPSVSDDLRSIRKNFRPSQDYVSWPSSVLVEKLRPWFSSSTLNQVMYLSMCVRKSRNPAKAAMAIALSATLRSVCAQDEGGSSIADNVLPKSYQLAIKKDAISTFSRRLNRLVEDVNETRKNLTPDALGILSSAKPDSLIAELDVRITMDFPPDEAVDLVVTSPPYPNMTDYVTSQRLSYYLLGAEPESDVHNEIGARRRRHRVRSLDSYQDDMKQAIVTISRKLKKKGYACLVMPLYESDSEREKVVQQSLAYLPMNKLIPVHSVDRILPRQRRYQRYAPSLKRERIYIFRKA